MCWQFHFNIKTVNSVQSTSGNSATPSLSKSEIDSLKEELQEKQEECDALRFTNEIVLQQVKNVSRISSRSWQRLKDEIIFLKKKDWRDSESIQ